MLKTFGIDWGHGKKLTVFDGKKNVPFHGNLYSFVVQNAPCRIVIESSFESYFREERNRCIDLAESLGCELLTAPSRLTEIYRRKHQIEKSDDNDSEVLFRLWEEGKIHLAKPRKTEAAKASRLNRIEICRRLGWPKDRAKEFLDYLPDKKNIGPEEFYMLGDGKRSLSKAFVLPLVAAALDVLESGGSRSDFDRIVGAFGHGYPSLYRSHFYYHRGRALRCRVHGVKSLKGVDDPDVRKDLFRRLRRATRWVFQQVKARKEQEEGTVR